MIVAFFIDNSSLNVVKFLHENVTPRCTGWAVPISSYKIRLTVHLSEALTNSHPLALSKTQLHVQESRLLWGHFIKLSMLLFLGSEVTWPSDNVAIVTGRSIRIKEVINQVYEAAGDNTGPSLGGNSAVTHGAGSSRALHPHCRVLATWNQNNCTRREASTRAWRWDLDYFDLLWYFSKINPGLIYTVTHAVS